MERKIRKLLRSKKGETIAEVLIALLLSSLALVMLASMISATNNMVGKSEKKMEDYYSQNERLENIHVSPRPASMITVSISGSGVAVTPTVPYAVNDELGTEVYAYDIP